MCSQNLEIFYSELFVCVQLCPSNMIHRHVHIYTPLSATVYIFREEYAQRKSNREVEYCG